ncbi:unnamed protein product, partial [Mesorhabditis spiculigera]
MLNLQYSFERYNANSNEAKQSIVVKARVRDMEDVEAAVFDLTDSLGTQFTQEDVYFNTPQGQLKLRIMHPNRCGALIYHSSEKSIGPKLSTSTLTEVEDVFSMRATLAAALGELGVIRKRRRVFIAEDVRIYLDDVDDIGQFVDIAISCSAKEPGSCTKRAEEILRLLRIQQEDVVPAAYLDLMMDGLTLEGDEDKTSSVSSQTNSSDGSDGM